jgi:hypothetical protein
MIQSMEYCRRQAERTSERTKPFIISMQRRRFFLGLHQCNAIEQQCHRGRLMSAESEEEEEEEEEEQ